MQPAFVERELNHRRHPCTHVAATLVRLERVVAQVCRAERAQHDLRDVDDAREIFVVDPHEATDPAWRPRISQKGSVLIPSRGSVCNPPAVQSTAATHRGDEFLRMPNAGRFESNVGFQRSSSCLRPCTNHHTAPPAPPMTAPIATPTAILKGAPRM